MSTMIIIIITLLRRIKKKLKKITIDSVYYSIQLLQMVAIYQQDNVSYCAWLVHYYINQK